MVASFILFKETALLIKLTLIKLVHLVEETVKLFRSADQKKEMMMMMTMSEYQISQNEVLILFSFILLLGKKL